MSSMEANKETVCIMNCYGHGLVNTVINQPWVQDTMHVAATTDVPTKWEGMNVATQFRRGRARTGVDH